MGKWERAIVTAAGFAAVGALWKAAEGDQRRRKIAPGRKIVILGAGFAGVAAAHAVASELPTGDGHQITLIDRNDYLLFTPMLTEAAGGVVMSDHIVKPVRHLDANVTFEKGDVKEIDVQNRRVTLGDGRVFDADHLLLALGSTTEYHHIPGLEEHSVSIKTLDDAVKIRDAARLLLSRAQSESDPEKRRASLTVVVGGAGYTGVETMAAVNDLMREEIVHFPPLSVHDLTMILADEVDRLLPELSEELADYAQKKLTERGVTIKMKSPVTGAGDGWVALGKSKNDKTGEKIQTKLLIWAGGVTPSPLVKALPCEKGKSGAIVVNGDCSVPNYDGLWAVGDNAEVPEKGSKKPYAPTAQNATREGALVGKNIIATLCDEATKPFSYTPIGELALVGKRAGVAKLYGLHISGILAWAMWRVVYLSKMPGVKQKFYLIADYVQDAVGKEKSA